MRLSRDAAAAEMLVVADSLSAFEGLSEELDAQFPGGGWSSVTPRALRKALDAAPPAHALIAVAGEERARLDEAAELVALCRGRGVGVILVVEGVPAAGVHRLMRAGAEDFLPVPVARGDLGESLERVTRRGPAVGKGGSDRQGLVYPVYGVAGGAGATVFAVNLAWELAQEGRKKDVRVCVLDLDLQYGSVATYLDLTRGSAVFELLSDLAGVDAAGFRAALTEADRRLSVLTAPAEALPLDFLAPEGLSRLLALARREFDVVVVDMPTAITAWTEGAITAAQRFWTVMEIDMRSAQNMLRFLRTVQAEELPVEKLDYVMNRVPGGLDLGAKGRVKKMAETLGIEYGIVLPDGGKAVLQACDHGSPLGAFAGGNALRKEIRKAARAILEEVLAHKAALA